MKHPSREINGSGRILYRVVEFDVPTSIGAWHHLPDVKQRSTPVMDACITEWSPSGEYVCLGGRWHKASEIELLEVLP